MKASTTIKNSKLYRFSFSETLSYNKHHNFVLIISKMPLLCDAAVAGGELLLSTACTLIVTDHDEQSMQRLVNKFQGVESHGIFLLLNKLPNIRELTQTQV